MKSIFAPYPEYQTTHLGWLDRIPAHWELKRLKYLGEAIIGLTYSPDDVVSENEGTLVLRSSNIQNKRLSFEDNVFVAKIVPEKLKTQRGDILICARNGSRALIGKNAQIEECAEGMTFGAFMSIFRSSYNDYLSKVFNSALFEFQSGSFLTATINQLTTGNLNSFEIPLPPEDERKLIASFLNRETAKIDTLIEKQQQLIKLLKEKRQAVISHAVTKGLNPDAPMKDSGVEWLGEVPEHWNVVPIKRVCDVKDGTHDTPQYVNPSSTSIPLITSKDFDGENISFHNAKHIALKDHQEIIKRSNTEVGDVLMSMIGGNIGKSLIVKGSCDFSIKNVALFKTNGSEVLANYINYYLKSGLLEVQIKLVSRGGAQGFLSLGDLRNLVFFMLTTEELSEIVEFLNRKTRKYDKLIEKAEAAILLINERRAALISAAVTGKIDVRNWKKSTRIDSEVA